MGDSNMFFYFLWVLPCHVSNELWIIFGESWLSMAAFPAIWTIEAGFILIFMAGILEALRAKKPD